MTNTGLSNEAWHVMLCATLQFSPAKGAYTVVSGANIGLDPEAFEKAADELERYGLGAKGRRNSPWFRVTRYGLELALEADGTGRMAIALFMAMGIKGYSVLGDESLATALGSSLAQRLDQKRLDSLLVMADEFVRIAASESVKDGLMSVFQAIQLASRDLSGNAASPASAEQEE